MLTEIERIREVVSSTPAVPRWSSPRIYEQSDGPELCTFAEHFCRHTKGPLRGKLVDFRGWQANLFRDLLERRPDGRRRHRRGLVGMPRKNGKSLLGSVLGIYGLMLDEPGAEVYSVAGSKEQARIVFGEAKKMVESDPELSEALTIYKNAIEFTANGSVWRVLSAEAPQSEGLNPSLVIFDEVHVQKNWDLWNVMTLGSGTRRDPLVLGITTAGFDVDSPCHELYEYGKRVAEGEEKDESFFFRWWEPYDQDADWRDPAVWAECNPALGDFLYVEDFLTAVKQTREAPFRRYKLNQWTSNIEAWIPRRLWLPLGAERPVDPTEPVVFGFDGAWAGDCTGLVGATLGDNPHLWVEALWEKRPGDGDDWRVPTAEVDHALHGLTDRFTVREIAMDPFRWEQTMVSMAEAGLPVVEWRTNELKRMVPACQKFEEGVFDGRFSHDGSPSLARHIENARVKEDHRGSRIVKESKSSKRKIDLAVAAVIAHDRATVAVEDEFPEPEIF